MYLVANGNNVNVGFWLSDMVQEHLSNCGFQIDPQKSVFRKNICQSVFILSVRICKGPS